MKRLIYALTMLIFSYAHPLLAMNQTIRFFTDEELGEALIGTRDYDNFSIKQLGVLDQGTTEGSTGGSCGQHALRNLFIALKRSVSVRDEEDALNDELLSPNDMLAMLGPDGELRKKVLQMRAGTSREGQCDWLTGAELIALTQDLPNNLPGDIHYSTYGECQRPSSDPQQPLAQAFSEIESLASGLTDEEFEDFMEYVSAHDTFVGGLILYEDLSSNILRDAFLFINYTLRDWISFITNTKLYRPEQSLHGHWIALMVISIEGKRQYIVMDSYGNLSRLHDRKIEQVIMLIENKRIDKASEILEPRFAEEANLLVQLRNEISVLGFAQEDGILDRIATIKRYDRSKNILFSLIALVLAYCYFNAHKATPKTAEVELEESEQATGLRHSVFKRSV